MKRMLNQSVLTLTSLVGLFVLVSSAVVAQESPPKEEHPKQEEAKPAESGEQSDAEDQSEGEGESEQPADPEEELEPLPDLDELLGLESDTRSGEADPELAELERMLNAQEATDAFAQAVTQMHDVAELLRVAKDTGVRTQRTQDEILKRLDVLIEQAQNSQSSSSSQQQSQPRPQQQQQQQQQGQQSQASNQRQGDNREEMLPPGGQDARLNNVLDAARAAWGSLPPRVRDVLLQGSSDRFSSLYESLTEEYYRRLAEESGGS